MDHNQEVLSSLVRAFDEQRLGHAILLVAQSLDSPGVQKQLKDFVKTLLCAERGSATKACEKCNSCQIFAQHEKGGEGLSHTDAVWLKPSEKGTYSVDEIRTLLHAFSLRTSISPCRVAFVESAEALSAQSHAPANALLKILEEPRPQSFLILSSSNPEAILPTIRSRCQSFRLFVGEEAATGKACPQGYESLCKWLEQGAPEHNPSWQSPASLESYWKDKNVAYRELKELYLHLWQRMRSPLETLDREAALRVWDFLNGFEDLLQKLRLNTQGHLQWIEFESNAKLRNYGNH